MQAQTTEDDARFFDWLAGFIDGEGCFQINKTGSGYRLRFTLVLRDDDAEILGTIVERAEIGCLYATPSRGNDRPQVRWEVREKGECRSLANLLLRHPLRAKKRRDFGIWLEALEAWERIAQGGRAADWSEIAALRDRLIAGRAYRPSTVTLVDAVLRQTCARCGQRFRVKRSRGRYPDRCQHCVGFMALNMTTADIPSSVADW